MLELFLCMRRSVHYLVLAIVLLYDDEVYLNYKTELWETCDELNDIPGIDADCGGGMACATCHVYVKEDWLDKLPTKEDGEEDMLDMAFEPKSNSRLSCQLTVSDELDGLVVNIPSKQC